jgi:PAS domain S-box-containing protein
MKEKTKDYLRFQFFAACGFLVYAAFFLCFHPIIGDGVAIFAFVPAVIIGWFRGMRRGLIAGITADVVTLLLLAATGHAVWDGFSLLQRMPGLFSVVLIAVLVGYMRDLRERVKKELEEKKRTEHSLRESEERFKAIYQGSSDALMLLTERGFFDCNQATLGMFGFASVEEFSHVHPADISPPLQPDKTESFPAAMERIKTAFEKGTNRFEWVHRRTSGEDFPAEVLLTAFDMNGKRVLQATVRDITQRKLAELALQQREATLHGIYMAAPIGIAVSSERTMVTINRQISEISGYAEEELVGRGARVFFVDDAEYERVGKKLYGNPEQREPASVEARWKRRDGTPIDVLLTAAPVEGMDHQIVTVMDITERKQAEEAVRVSEEKLRRIFENLQDVYYETSLDGTIIEISPSIEIVSKGQYHRNDMIGRSMSDLYSDDGQRQVLLSELKKRGSVADFEITLKNHDGSLVPCSISSKIGFDAEGRPKSIMGSMRDITRRKLAEGALRKSEAVMRGIYSAAPVGISVSTNRMMQTINEQLCQISGYSAEELIGKSARKYYVDDSEYERVGRELYTRDGHGRFGNVEARWRRKDGTLIDVIISMAPMDSTDPSAGEVVTVLDITKRKEAERELQESEKRFNTAFVHSPVSMSITCAATSKYVEANENFFRDTGFERDQVIGHTSAELGLFCDPDDRQRLVAQARRQGFVRDMEMRFRVKTGEIRDCLISTQPITLNGEPHFLLTAVDITERKRTEEALRQSEEKLRVLFEKAGDIILFLEITPEGMPLIREANSATLKLLGYERDELIGRPVSIINDAPDDSDVVGVRRQHVLSEPGKVFEAKHRCKDGTVRDFECSVTEMQVGPTTLGISVERDITKRKQAEQALAESELNFRRMFEITSEGVALVNPETGRIVAANPAMCGMFGYAEEEFRSLTPEDITPAESKEVMRRSMKTLSDGGTIPDHEGISVRKDGSKVNVIVSNRHMFWQGEPVFHVTFKDVTFLKAMQEQLKKKNTEILEFTDMVTHDLRKPLTTMNIVFGLAKKSAFGPLNADGKEAFDTGLEASKYMQEMLEDLLSCARLESGTQELAIEETRLGEVVEPVLTRMKYQIEEKKIQVVLPDKDISVMADKKQLTRVLMNLVGNAINYIGSGPDKFIRIAWEQKNGAPVFMVADNGIGVPEGSRKDLFAKFKRGSNVSGVQGTGLGLSIVKGIVEAHGGKIWFESEVGKGTTFYFTLAGTGKKS